MDRWEPVKIVRTRCLNCRAGIGFRVGDRYYADEARPAFCCQGCAEQYRANIKRLPKACADALRLSLDKGGPAMELTDEQRDVIRRLLLERGDDL